MRTGEESALWRIPPQTPLQELSYYKSLAKRGFGEESLLARRDSLPQFLLPNQAADDVIAEAGPGVVLRADFSAAAVEADEGQFLAERSWSTGILGGEVPSPCRSARALEEEARGGLVPRTVPTASLAASPAVLSTTSSPSEPPREAATTLKSPPSRMPTATPGTASPL